MVRKLANFTLITTFNLMSILSINALDTITVNNGTQEISLFGSGEFFMDESRKLNFTEIETVSFKSEKEFIAPPRPQQLNYIYWHKYALQNNSDSLFAAILKTGHFSQQSIYIYEGNKLIEKKVYGIKVPKNQWPVPLSQRAVNIDIPPQTTYVLFLKKEWPRSIHGIHIAELYNPKEFNTNEFSFYYSIRANYYFRIFFIGILGFLFLFTIVQYIQHHDRAYLYYSVYLLVMTIYFIERHESNPYFNFFFSYNPCFFNSNGGGEPSYYAQLSFIFYLLFTIEFLDINENYGRLRRYLLALIVIIFLLYAIQLLMVILNVQPSILFNYYYSYRAVLNMPLIIVLIWIALKIRTKLAVFFLMGSGILTLTMIIPQFTYLIDKNLGGSFFYDSMTWMQVGMLFECFLFSIGLGYKHKLAFEERDQIQQELISKSEENIALTLRYNTELEAEVKEKTSELISQKEQLIKSEYEKEVMDLESEVFRSKMNPHFIYNSLNSIKYFALTKSSEETAQYITDFSILMRFILENSKEALISLGAELEFIKNYVLIESRRFDGKFTYDFQIDQQLDLNLCYIPPMLLQPIIENAIEHGLLPKQSLGHLSIRLIKINDQIRIDIEDNGVGRNNKIKPKNKNQYFHKTSMSTSIIRARIKNIYKHHSIKIRLEITDLKENERSIKGTLVTIHMPMINRHFTMLSKIGVI